MLLKCAAQTGNKNLPNGSWTREVEMKMEMEQKVEVEVELRLDDPSNCCYAKAIKKVDDKAVQAKVWIYE